MRCNIIENINNTCFINLKKNMLEQQMHRKSLLHRSEVEKELSIIRTKHFIVQ